MIQEIICVGRVPILILAFAFGHAMAGMPLWLVICGLFFPSSSGFFSGQYL
jgi:hypothetical protein